MCRCGFQKNFSLVVQPQMIKAISTLALRHNWQMHQLDVNNAFLQGSLFKEFFMTQPPCPEDSQHPDYVCKLHKAIYRLCQAPWTWHEALKSFITSHGFITNKSDPSLFIYATGKQKYTSLYVWMIYY